MPLDHAILAFLEHSPMSGYDLKKAFDQSVAHFWSATQSHIYKSLDNSEKKGWAVTTLIAQDGRPSRKEYHITGEGRAELRRWLTTPLPLEPVREAALIQIFFSYSISNDEIAGLFETRIREIQERLIVLRTVAQAAIDQAGQSDDTGRARQLSQITLDYGIDYYEFELAWHEKTLRTIRNLPPLSR
jgi:DNA-binding PadR family transcriptional regulator